MKLKWLAHGSRLATVHSWMCSSTAVVGSTHQASSTLTVGVAVSISKTTGPILCALRAAVSRVGYVPFAVVGATEETA